MSGDGRWRQPWLAAITLAAALLAGLTLLHLERPATRLTGTAQLRAGRAGDPALWIHPAVVAGDEADLYLPLRNGAPQALPIALLLQGANVEKRHYASFAAALARQGFLVVVPNHWRTFPPLPLLGRRILLADQRQIGATITALQTLNRTAPAPLRGAIDAGRLVVVGHSMGGLAGLEALADRCRFPLCLGLYHRPVALRGGVFYGTDLRGHGAGPVDPIDTDDRPVALIRGSRDGASSPADVEATWAQIRTPRKALLTIEGANHYALTTSSRPVNLPGWPPIHPDPHAATADQAATIAAIARWSGRFLREEALGQAPEGSGTARPQPSAAGVEVRVGS